MTTMFTNAVLNSLYNLTSGGNRHLIPAQLLMLISLFMRSHCAPTDDFQYCLSCDDFNRQSIMNCATSYQECGDCKTGFIQDEEDLRLCYAVEILEDPVKEIVQRTGSEVILTCIFNAKVWCVWTKDTNQVDIHSSSRYGYLSPDGGKTKRYDCSIRIEHLSMNDVGQWQCENMADDNMDSVKGQYAQISIENSNMTNFNIEEGKLTPIIKLNDGNVNGQEIGMDKLQAITIRRRRDLVEERNTLECQVAVIPSELRWEIDGNVTIGVKMNDSSIHLNQSHLVEAMEAYRTSELKLTCVVEYDSGQTFTSYVIIRAEDKVDSNEQSSRKTQSTDKLPEVVLLETHIHRCDGDLYATTIRISMVAYVMLLIWVFIMAIICILIVVFTIMNDRHK